MELWDCFLQPPAHAITFHFQVLYVSNQSTLIILGGKPRTHDSGVMSSVVQALLRRSQFTLNRVLWPFRSSLGSSRAMLCSRLEFLSVYVPLRREPLGFALRALMDPDMCCSVLV